MEPARQRDLRGRNLATVLAAVAASSTASSPLSRAQVAAATGLTRATVSALVEPLLAAGLVREDGRTSSPGAGRPGAALVLSGERVAALGVEIGVDHLGGCVRDLTGAVRAREVALGDRRGIDPEQVVADSAALAARLLAAAAGQGLDVVGARWAVPGLVDAAGCVRLAPNLGWRDVDVAALIAASPWLEQLRQPGRVGIDIDNEASCAALAEVWSPAAGLSATGGMLLVSGEVGVGAAVVLDGQLVRGQHGWSGEIGHLTVAADGPPCRCGATGCLEVYAGQEVLLRAAGLPDGAQRWGERAASAVREAAERAEPAALAALERAGHALGVAIAGAVNLLDVDEVVLGGLYGPLAPWLLERVETEVGRRVLRAQVEPVRVRRSRWGGQAAVLGAAAGVLAQVMARPEPVVSARLL